MIFCVAEAKGETAAPVAEVLVGAAPLRGEPVAEPAGVLLSPELPDAALGTTLAAAAPIAEQALRCLQQRVPPRRASPRALDRSPTTRTSGMPARPA